MGYRDSQNPHLKYNGLSEIRDALWKHCRVTDGSMPSGIIKSVTDILPQEGWSMTDGQLAPLANTIVDMYRKDPKNPFSPSLLGIIFNGLLENATFAPSSSGHGPENAPRAAAGGKIMAQQAFQALISATTRNPDTGFYDRAPVIRQSKDLERH